MPWTNEKELDSGQSYLVIDGSNKLKYEIGVIGQKVCVKSAVNLDRYWVYSYFIFFDKDKGWTKSVCKNMREPT